MGGCQERYHRRLRASLVPAEVKAKMKKFSRNSIDWRWRHRGTVGSHSFSLDPRC
jgi:hypothetical protein